MQCLAHDKLRLVRLEVALALFLGGLRGYHRLVDHRLHNPTFGIRKRWCDGPSMVRQQTRLDGFLTQQLGVRNFTQGGGVDFETRGN